MIEGPIKKNTGKEASYGTSKANVHAIPVSGYTEYFEKQKENHVNTPQSPLLKNTASLGRCFRCY
jgi:hypothetical protein